MEERQNVAKENVGSKKPMKDKPVKKEKKKERTGGGISRDKKVVIYAGVPLLLAAVVFFIMVTMENHIVNSVETRAVVVAKTDVPEGISLTRENIPSYFTVAQRAVNELPVDTYSSGHELVGVVISNPLSKNQVLTSNSVTGEDFFAGIDEPVEISIELNKLGQAVGGTLRAGDLVDILHVVDVSGRKEVEEEDVADIDVPPISSSEERDNASEQLEAAVVIPPLEEETASEDDAAEIEDMFVYGASENYACYTLLENVRVTAVFNSAGQGTNELEKNNVVQVATVVNVAVPRSMADKICLALEEGTVRLSRVVSMDRSVNENEEMVQDNTDEISGTAPSMEEIQEDMTGDTLLDLENVPLQTEESQEEVPAVQGTETAESGVESKLTE